MPFYCSRCGKVIVQWAGQKCRPCMEKAIAQVREEHQQEKPRAPAAVQHCPVEQPKIMQMYLDANRDGQVEIWRSQHNDSANIFTSFNDWAAPEKVMAVGSVSGSLGTIEAVGEPTLTSSGDLYFVVVYCKNADDQTDYDSCDIDPWVATKK